MAPDLGVYLHATVNVVDPAASVSTQAYANVVGAAPATGLYLGLLHLNTWISGAISGIPQANFNISREEWVTSQGGSTDVLLENPTFGKSLSQLIAQYGAGSSTPVRVIDGNPTAATNLETRSILGVLGINADYIRGYNTSSSQLAGFIRGDAPFFVTGLAQAGALIQGGKALPLLITVKPVPGSLYRSLVTSVPTFAQVIAKYPPKTKLLRTEAAAMGGILDPPTNSVMILPTGAGSEQLTAIRTAVQWTYARSDFKTLMRGYGLPGNFVQPVQAKALFGSLLKLDKTLAPYNV